MIINISNKNVFYSACLFVGIVLMGMFITFLVGNISTPLSIYEMQFYMIIGDMLVNIGAAYCLLFVIVWIINYNRNQ